MFMWVGKKQLNELKEEEQIEDCKTAMCPAAVNLWIMIQEWLEMVLESMCALHYVSSASDRIMG